MKKIAIVNCDLFANEIAQNDDVKYYKLYKKTSFVPFWIGKVCRKLHLFRWANINPELENLNADCIVVFDSGFENNFILKWFEKKYGDARLIFYYWNPVFTSISPDRIPPKFEKWSYSPSDCEKYGMKYNSTFYFKQFCRESVECQRDVFFIGKDKGRREHLIKLKSFFDSIGVSNLFYLTATHPRLKKKKFFKAIPYKTTLNYVNESKAVLDYYIDPFAGLSLRAMESIFFNKKMITNNQTVVKYNFYKKENVLLIDKDNLQSVKSFLSSQYSPIDIDIKNYYLFENWLKRFN